MVWILSGCGVRLRLGSPWLWRLVRSSALRGGLACSIGRGWLRRVGFLCVFRWCRSSLGSRRCGRSGIRCVCSVRLGLSCCFPFRGAVRPRSLSPAGIEPGQPWWFPFKHRGFGPTRCVDLSSLRALALSKGGSRSLGPIRSLLSGVRCYRHSRWYGLPALWAWGLSIVSLHLVHGWPVESLILGGGPV